jgi:hypothetical protein
MAGSVLRKLLNNGWVARNFSNMANDEPELGAICYNAYCEAVGWVAFNGDRLPTWEELPDRRGDLQEAWQRAAKAVVTYTSQ